MSREAPCGSEDARTRSRVAPHISQPRRGCQRHSRTGGAQRRSRECRTRRHRRIRCALLPAARPPIAGAGSQRGSNLASEDHSGRYQARARPHYRACRQGHRPLRHHIPHRGQARRPHCDPLPNSSRRRSRRFRDRSSTWVTSADRDVGRSARVVPPDRRRWPTYVSGFGKRSTNGFAAGINSFSDHRPRPPARCCGPSRRRRSPWNGADRPPVGVAGQPARVEQRALDVRRALGRAVVGLDAQLQPGQAGQPHLGPQPQQPPGLDLLDPPEVQRLADVQPVRVAPAAAQADAADEPVEQPRTRQASGNEYQPCSPPMPSTTRHSASGAASYRRAAARRCRGCRRPSPGRWAAGRWVRPGTDAEDQRVATSASRIRCSASSTARVEAEQAVRRVRHVRGDVVLVARPPRARSDSTSGRAMRARHRGDQPDPEAGQARGQHRHREDEPAAAARRPRRSAASCPR